MTPNEIAQLIMRGVAADLAAIGCPYRSDGERHSRYRIRTPYARLSARGRTMPPRRSRTGPRPPTPRWDSCWPRIVGEGALALLRDARVPVPDLDPFPVEFFGAEETVLWLPAIGGSLAGYLQRGRGVFTLPGDIGMLCVLADMHPTTGDGTATACAYAPGAGASLELDIPGALGRAFIRGDATAGQVLDALLDRGCLRAERMLARMHGQRLAPGEDDENITDFPESP